jgi:rod shape-determining protein MreD
VRWLVFAVVVVVAVALDTSFMPRLFALKSVGQLYPQLVAAVVAYVALYAPRLSALWAAWGAGLLLDLALVQPAGLMVGPHALGFTFGAFLVLQLRSIVFRKRVLTVAVLTVICLGASAFVEVAIFALRTWTSGDVVSAGFRPLIELLRRLGMALYSGIVAVPLAWLLLKSQPAWGFLEMRSQRSRGH